MFLPIRHGGPLSGEATPRHGGAPGATGCNGCVDCCHLPEISVTDEEANQLRVVYPTITVPIDPLRLTPDPAHDGWQIMHGPCVFRRLDTALAVGGCRIYDHRPAGCRIFTCALRLNLSRQQ